MSESETPIKTPKDLILAILAAFILPIVIIVLLTQFVGFTKNSTSNSDAYTEEAIEERLSPLGKISTQPLAGDDGSGTNKALVVKTSLATGEEVYTARCAACHAAGVLNAPKIGDIDTWKPRLTQGLDALVYSALNGKGSMGAQKGSQHSDDEIQRAVVYLLNESGGEFK